MNKSLETVAIYGIQDKADSEYPVISHDHNITIFSNGRIQNYLHFERLSGEKYDNSFPSKLYQILKEKKYLNSDKFDLVFVDNVLGRSFINKQGNIRFEGPITNSLKEGIEKGRCYWLDHQTDAYVLNHELAHIYSCLPFFGNFKDNSLLIHFDGGASLSNFSAWIYKSNVLKKIEESWNLEYLSSIYNSNALVFSIIGADIKEQNSVAGKFMGFASFGKYRFDIEEWLVKNNYFKDIWKRKKVFFNSVYERFGVELKSFDQKEVIIQDIANTLQFIFQRDLIKHITSLKEQTGTQYLYYSGGSALNIIVNTNLINAKIFDDVFIPPCTNDSGLSIGAGAFLEFMKHGNIEYHSPYLNNWDIESYSTSYNKSDIEQLANIIMQGKVVGISNNYGEAGPRALGNRSILALPSSKKIAKKVSEEIKKREWYRPVAPIMLERNVRYYTNEKEIHHLSRYMLLEFQILQEKRKEIEGVVHVDGTSRIQTIFKRDENPFIYDLLDLLDAKYNVKALINTSFNVKGKPIVHTSQDAIEQAEKMSLNAVVINGKLMNL